MRLINIIKRLLDVMYKGFRRSGAKTKVGPIKSTKREQVLSFLQDCRKDIEVDDLPNFVGWLSAFFESQSDSAYYQMLDLCGQGDTRVVVVGDTHCDLNSLSNILAKLCMSSDYDYFEKGYIVFLGDYIDRGEVLFEYLRLLIEIKVLLGDRCILLKGNHELIGFNQSEQLLNSCVIPSNTCPLLNEYCADNKHFLRLFADYFNSLPCYLWLRQNVGNTLLVHGGIPRHCYLDQFEIVPQTGEMLCDTVEMQNNILDNMLWGDPCDRDFVIQSSDRRFYFGKNHFEAFAEKTGVYRVIRSHEPVQYGVRPFYDGRLYTIFSNGGEDNSDTGYPNVKNPVFAILMPDGTPIFESIHYRLLLKPVIYHNNNKMNTDVVTAEQYHLNKEFIQ